jgi:SAM-dependent methyltransferase
MTDLTHTGIRLLALLALLALQALWLGPAHSQGGASPKIEEQISIQESIYRSRGDAVPEGYVIDRSLLSYTFTLSDGFDDSLASLGPNDRWLDVGAGQGRAILDYYTPRYDSMHVEGRERRGTKARSVAISIEDRRTPLWHETAAGLEGNKIQYLFGKRLREYSLQELGKFRLITDVIGGFSYSTDLSRFMENVLDFLELNGSFYSLLQDVSSEAGTNKPFYPGAPFLTEIKNADGSELKICSWLKSISCVEVSCELKDKWKPPIEVYHVKKVCSDVRVPTLAPVHFEAGTPPERGYRLGKPSPSTSAPAGAAR